MAEFVNQRLEEMLGELEQMKRIELYTLEEIKIISKKRKDFEYKIHRHIRCKEDFYNYISYECILLKDVRLRRENNGIKDKKGDIEYTITKRIIKLFKEMISRFPDDIEIWLHFMEFCKTASFINTVTSYLEKLVQMHGDKHKVWQLAARWEYEESNNIDNARKFVLKGLQRHPDSEDLYIDMLRMEMLTVQAINDDHEEKEKQAKRVEIILKNALENVSKIDFIVKLYKTVEDFEWASDIRSKFIVELWEKHRGESETWNFIADCELNEKDTSGFDWTLLSVGFFSSNYPQNVQKFVEIHEIAILHIPTKKSVMNFINSSIKLVTNKKITDVTKLQVISHALAKGHSKKYLNEEHYKIWLELMCSDDNDQKEELIILKMLEEACSYLPTSVTLWLERMKRSIDNEKDLLDLFKKAKRAIPTENIGEIWKFIVQNTKNLLTLRNLYQQSLTLLPKTASVVKPLFLESFYELEGIDTVRKEYRSMAINTPFTLELHNIMIDIENRQPKRDVERLRYCHELSSQQFGKKDSGVWLKYVQFEIKNGHPEKCSALYKRACAALDASLVDRFVAEYGEVVMET